MEAPERKNLKSKIEADLELLIDNSWHMDVIKKLNEVLSKLREIEVESYDD